MSQQKGVLPAGSYGGIKGEDLKPYVSAETKMVEFSPLAIVVGIICAVLFAMSNTYLGLKVGLTISAGIPSSILGVGILKALRKNTILQDNIVQGMGAMGESLASGLIFTVATLLLWGINISLWSVFILVIIASALGIYLTSIFRRFLIVEEHGKELVFPESMAIAEVIVNSAEGESKGFKAVIQGVLVGGIYKLFFQGLGFVKEEVNYPIWRTQFGFQLYPSLMGLGYIIGPKIASYLFSGGILAWFAIIPLISFFGAHIPDVLTPGTKLISQMDPSTIWSSYIRYIGAGAVTMAGFLSLGKNLPSILRSFKAAIAGQMKSKGANVKTTTLRSETETPMVWVLGIVVACFLLIWFLPLFKYGIIPALLVIFFCFFFGVVSGRMCGVIGVSNNPVSGMTIASLLIVTVVIKLMGHTGKEAMVQAIFLGIIICCAISVAGAYMQAMKVSYIFGGTTRRLDFVMFISALFAGLVGAFTLLLVNKAYIVGSAAAPAPQANLMRVVVEGIMGGNLPWDLIFIGAALSVVTFIMGLPALLIGIGIYLPVSLSASVFLGGVIFWLLSKMNKKDPAKAKESEQLGSIFASGLIAGDALSGVILAVTIVCGLNLSGLGSSMPFFKGSMGDAFSVIMYLVVGLLMVLKLKASKKTN